MTVSGVKCRVCGDEIWSRHRHDFRYCKCGECFVDGGRDYLRCGAMDLGNLEVVEITIDGVP
jgi:hypothetical protein